MKKLHTNEFRLHYKTEGVLQNPEEFKYSIKGNKPFDILMESDPTDNQIRQYFRDMLKKFNSTLRPHEKERIFFKVDRKYYVQLKSGKKDFRYYNV